ncbi:MAG: hypothetical protein FWH33_07225 [Oscillospiraceae bacterium]|nr:hypothetical protein [Oscillospiraceae bacterium]
MSRKDKIRLAVLAAVIIVLAIVAVSLLGRTKYEPMHTAQNEAEAGTVYQAVLDMGEQAKVEGVVVYVPEGRRDVIRARLAAEGALESEEFDLSILSGASGFGVTESYQKKIFEAQREAEIRAQILKFDKIQSATVIVNLGEYSPFVISSGVREATATAVLTVRGSAALSSLEAQVIADLMKNNVPGLKYENITITDSNMNPYKIGIEIEDIDTILSSRIATRNLLQQQFEMQGDQILMPIFGANNCQVTVSVTLNYDKIVTEEVEFFPPVAGEYDGIVRSSSELYENQRNRAAAEGIPGTDSNAMGTVEYPYVTLQDGDEYRKSLIEKNYEIDETRRIIEHEQGKIEKMSVSVLLNSDAVFEDYSAEVSNLVSRGLGVSEDYIAVERLPFKDDGIDYAKILEEQQAAAALARRREVLQMVLMWAVILLLGLALISMVKSIVRTIKGPEPEEEPLLAEGAIDYLVDDEIPEVDPYDDIELQTKSTALEQIERFIDKDPAAVAQLLRNWLTDEM